MIEKLVALMALSSLLGVAVAEDDAAADVDYGDYTSQTLQVKSWEALNEGNFEHVLQYTAKCTELYEEKAREMQASLSAKPDAKETHDYWALNDVGTCYFIRGEALTKLRRYEEALAAFTLLKDDLYYAQAWDPKGWFWSPSDAAYPRIEMLKARTKKDF